MANDILLDPGCESAVDLHRQLGDWFGSDMTLWDADNDQPIELAEPLTHDSDAEQRARLATHQESSVAIVEVGPLAMLTLRIEQAGHTTCAAGVFVVDASRCELESAADWLGVTPDHAAAWIQQQDCWTVGSLRRVANLVMARLGADSELRHSKLEIDDLADSLAASFEEISLLYKVLENLHDSDDVDSLIGLAMDWLVEVLPAQSVALELLPTAHSKDDSAASQLLTRGKCPVDRQQFRRLVRQLGTQPHAQPFVVNVSGEPAKTWRFPEIKELVVVPVLVGDHPCGWLAAFNHNSGGWFGTTEARLLRSVATILGMHSEKLELYRYNAELRASKSDAENRIGQLKNKLDDVSHDLASVYSQVSFTHEGINLLSKLAASLTNVEHPEQLIQLALDSLVGMLPIEGVALELRTGDHAAGQPASQLLTRGDFPLDLRQLGELLTVLKWHDQDGPLNVNRRLTIPAGETPSPVRQLIVVPLAQRGDFSGRLAALNHLEGKQFNTAEVGLLSAVGELISIRCGIET